MNHNTNPSVGTREFPLSLDTIKTSLPAVLFVLVSLFNVGRRFLFDYRLLTDDAAFFLHGGWYMSQGANLYTNIWDINPPVPFEISWIFSLVTGGNTRGMYALAVLTSIVLGAGIILLITDVVLGMTEDVEAAMWAGLCLLVVPGFHWNASAGIHPKYLVMFLGFASLYFAIRSRPALAGACVAAATLSWQLGAFFLPLAFGLLLSEDRITNTVWYITGGIVTTAVIFAPIALTSGVRPFLLEVVIAPSKTGDAISISNLGKILTMLGISSIPMALGVFGALLHDKTDSWWILCGGTLFLFQLVALDFDGRRDMYVGLCFAAVGFGLLVAHTNRERLLKAMVALLLVVSIGPLGGFGVVDYSVTASEQARPPHPLFQSSIHAIGETVGVSGTSYQSLSRRDEISQQNLFWNTISPDHCHYMMSRAEIQWMDATGVGRDECGQLPLRQV
ncbi:DolP-mannose mannosyltransferase [Halorussus sp. MSC15.2]|uniref:DolP-mannose mannosyltransferase n=1 Tax=Halorussus sp. MSC15.2 TaxID=2283638 RepID=UPI0013D0A79C|nr:DolP-mannose mannosyltransferase [Halorussus sp. MSC15.2]NEU55351.1 hypothetical protein [Halorussus sp. MSC15.2]